MSPFKTLLVLLTLTACCNADFVETFSGTGPYASSRDVLTGFDNPGWRYVGDGMFRDGGLWVENPRIFPEDNVDVLSRFDIEWKGEFTSTVEIRDHVLTLEEPGFGSARISFASRFDSEILAIGISPSIDVAGSYRAQLTSGDRREVLTVEQGPHMLLSISFDEGTSRATYRYDDNLDDNVPPITLGTLDYSSPISETVSSGLSIRREDAAQADALIDHWTFTSSEPPIFPGDFNASVLNCFPNLTHAKQLCGRECLCVRVLERADYGKHATD